MYEETLKDIFIEVYLAERETSKDAVNSALLAVEAFHTKIEELSCKPT
jgi:hypothetical protein